MNNEKTSTARIVLGVLAVISLAAIVLALMRPAAATGEEGRFPVQYVLNGERLATYYKLPAVPRAGDLVDTDDGRFRVEDVRFFSRYRGENGTSAEKHGVRVFLRGVE